MSFSDPWLIAGIQPLSTIDYPNKTSYVIFVQGCNFMCGYCHNPELLGTHIKKFQLEDVLADIESRKKILDGVVISGGEPTIYPELPLILKWIKDMGLPIKLDTNGYRPDVLHDLFEQGLVDYVAMDIKTSLPNYRKVVGLQIDIARIETSIRLIMASAVDYEFRTTMIPKVIMGPDIYDIIHTIRGANKYVLQQFSPAKCYNKKFEELTPYEATDLYGMADLARHYINHVEIRNL